jgi:O-antigen ligase
MAGQVVLVVVVAALLLSRNRSAWAGSAVGLLVAAGLYLRYVRGSLGFQKHQIVIPVLMVLLSFGLFLTMSRTGGMLTQRLGTLSVLERDSSFRWRRAMWDKAARMIRDRPVLGWGVGSYPLQQALYYHPDAPGRSQLEIYYTGPTLKENAHNTFLQLGAELGIPGLALFLGIYAAFLATAWRALRPMRAGFRQAVLIGAVAGTAGQLVSGVGSPAWEFAECSLFFWVILGLGMAVAGIASRGVETSGQKGASYEGVRGAAAVS